MFIVPYLSPVFFWSSFLFSPIGITSIVLFAIKYKYITLLCLLPAVFFRKTYGFHENIFKGTLKRYFGNTNTYNRITIGKFIFAIKTYGYYTRLALIPNRLGQLHKFGYGYGLTKDDLVEAHRIDGDFVIGATLLITTIYILFNHYQPYGFFLLWYLVNISIAMNIIIINQRFTERYLYLANVGLTMFVASHLAEMNYGSYLFLALIVFYITRLWYAMPMYYDFYWLIEHELFQDKTNYAMWNWKGFQNFRIKRIQDALDCFEKSAHYKPNFFKPLYNLSMMFALVGNIERAEEYFDKASSNLILEREVQDRELLADLREIIEMVKEQKKTGKLTVDISKFKVIV